MLLARAEKNKKKKKADLYIFFILLEILDTLVKIFGFLTIPLLFFRYTKK
jgi:hypothetical protein